MPKPVYSYISVLLLLGAILAALGCDKHPDMRPERGIAVTNAYLLCAVTELTGGDEKVLCLAPPGMCPGHFDLSPGQVRQLAECRLLLRADFQHRIEDSLGRMKENGLKIISIPALAGMCIPENYLQTCRDVHMVLAEHYDVISDELYEKRLLAAEERLNKLSGQVSARADSAGLRGVGVVCSGHQAEFAGWLGLNVVATFVGSDTETVANLQRVLEKASGERVRFVIANRQEGTALAEALADRLDAGVVVFSNFPDVQAGRNNFDTLVTENLNALLEADGL